MLMCVSKVAHIPELSDPVFLLLPGSRTRMMGKIPQVFARIQGETAREKPCGHNCLENYSRHTYYKERLSKATP